MAIINDYADIRAKMKGELKAQPKTLITAEELEKYPFIIRAGPILPAPAVPPRQHLMCPDCQGKGRDTHYVPGGFCQQCQGKGYV